MNCITNIRLRRIYRPAAVTLPCIVGITYDIIVPINYMTGRCNLIAFFDIALIIGASDICAGRITGYFHFPIQHTA